MTLERRRKPLKLDNLLVRNVNSWGNVQYNYPLRLSSNETRTSTGIAHRLIPPIPYKITLKEDKPFPDNVVGRDVVVEKETFRTTSGEYCVKPNPNKATERADCAINCKRVNYMTAFEKNLLSKNIAQPFVKSEVQDNFRGLQKPLLAPDPIIVKAPDPEYIFDIVASGRAETPVIPETATGCIGKQCDPYLTTYRNYHRPFTRNEWMGIGAKDNITFYSELNVPKTRGFGPRYKPDWMPLKAKVHRAVYDRSYVKKEFKEVAACRNPVDNIKGIFKSETHSKFTQPFLAHYATWSHGESFDHAPIPPNPYQATMAPFMYCTDYCHIKTGTKPSMVVDQYVRYLPPHKNCVERYIVSKDLGP